MAKKREQIKVICTFPNGMSKEQYIEAISKKTYTIIVDKKTFEELSK